MSEHLHTGFRAVPGPMSFMAEVEMREPPLPFSRLRPAVDRATGTGSTLWHEASRRWLNSSFKASSRPR